MFGKLSKNTPLKNVLVFSLTNVGDVILTCPVIDVLLRDFPDARLTVVVGPKGRTLFEGHPRIDAVVYDKHASLLDQGRWLMNLRKTPFDAVIDLRQTALGLFIPTRWQTSFIPPSVEGHMRLEHLAKLQGIYPDAALPVPVLAIIPKPVSAIDGLGKFAVLSPGSANSAKRWPPAGFAVVADYLVESGHQIIIVGSKDEESLVASIQGRMKHAAISLAGKTDLRELAFVVSRAALVVANDSGCMHLSSYLNAPVVTMWGPSDPSRFGPWSTKAAAVQRDADIASIPPEDVISAIARLQ